MCFLWFLFQFVGFFTSQPSVNPNSFSHHLAWATSDKCRHPYKSMKCTRSKIPKTIQLAYISSAQIELTLFFAYKIPYVVKTGN